MDVFCNTLNEYAEQEAKSFATWLNSSACEWKAWRAFDLWENDKMETADIDYVYQQYLLSTANKKDDGE